MRRDFRAQYECCLTSDLDEGAKVLWCYLMTTGRSLGIQKLAERLQLIDIDIAVEVLLERNLLQRKAGSYRALPFLISKNNEDTVAAPMRGVSNDMLEIYNRVKREHGVFAVSAPTAKALEKLEELAEFLNDAGVDFESYLKWAIEKTAFLQKKKPPVPFVPIAILSGDWLKGEFTETPFTGQAAPTHAGKRYGDQPALREQLVAAGFARAREFDQGKVRYILNYAENMRLNPIAFATPDPKYPREIMWVLSRLKAGDALRA